MHTDKAREIIAAHATVDRALANLRNAGAMTTDDPKAQELLERAGDSYASAYAALYCLQVEVVDVVTPVEAEQATENPDPFGVFALDSVVWITGDGYGHGYVQASTENLAEGHVAVRFEEDGKWRGQPVPKGAVVSIPATELAKDPPVPAAITPGDGTAPGAEAPRGEASSAQGEAKPPPAAA